VVSAKVVLHRAEGSIAQQTASDTSGKFHFAAVESGAYTLKTDAPGFYPNSYDFVLRARQPLSLTVELQPKQAVQQTVQVKAGYMTVDPEKTGSSYTFTQQDLEKLPDPLIDTTNDLVNNLMPGASDSHDNFLAVRGTEFSLHEFINGVSFLDNTQPQFSPGISPQIFETVDLMTGGFTPEYGNRFGGVLDITTRSGADLGGHGDIDFRGATVDTYDLNADYGGQKGRLGYYFFVDGFTSGRFLDPPEPHELFDFGKGSRATIQLDWRAGTKDTIKLLLMGEETISSNRISAMTRKWGATPSAIFASRRPSWPGCIPSLPRPCCRLLYTSAPDPIACCLPQTRSRLFRPPRGRRLRLESRATFLTTGTGISSRPAWTWFACAKTKASFLIAAAIRMCSPASAEGFWVGRQVPTFRITSRQYAT
jgi:hypothetical protein